MTKAKFLIITLLVSIILFVTPTVVNAAVEYTRTIPSNEGTIKINFTGLELDETKAYQFALVRQGGTPENWFSIEDGYTSTTATITLSSATAKIVEVLKQTDTGFVYIREKDNTTDYVLESYKVNLKLPYLQSLAYSDNGKEYNLRHVLYNSIGTAMLATGPTNIYVKWEKITDKELIEDYLDIKNNKKSITDLEKSLPELPTTGYRASREENYTQKNDGLYLLWVKRIGENCKEVYSCIVHDGLPEGTKVEDYLKGIDLEKPTVKSIKVTSPEEGTYKTKQIVKILVTFSEKITGETVPTLKIKFGTSDERTLTNGTIKDETIEYTYEIVDTDKGQLAVTSLAGGTIKDAAGNEAVIETKILEGNAIKANVETTTEKEEDKTDKEEPKDDETEKEEDKADKEEPKTEDKKEDDTVSKDKLPDTGLKMGIALFIVVAICGTVAYFKYNKLKNI